MQLNRNLAEEESVEGSRWSVDFSATKPLLPPKVDWETVRRTKFQIWKNVAVVTVGVGIFTMGLNPMDDLQSSLNSDDGLGVASLGVKYAAMILGNLLTNIFLIRKLGSKWALIVGALLYSLYIVANFYPTWALLLPLTAVAGLGGALMWTTLGNYLAKLACHYAAIAGRDQDAVTAMFFGVKGFAGYSSAALGGLVSSLILQTGVSNGNFTADRYDVCGSRYCNEALYGKKLDTANGNVTFSSNDLDAFSWYGLCAFCLAVTLFAVVIVGVLADPLPSIGIVERKELTQPLCHLFLATVRQWTKRKQLLLIPISLVFGFQEAFWRVEFSKAYVTCALGIQYIGFLMVCYNVAALFSSLGCGWLGNRTARLVAFPVMAALDIGALTSMLYWKPTANGGLIAFIITGITGATYGGLSTLILAFYGVAFPADLDAAYSNLYFWTFLGSTLMYASSFQLCLRIKLIIVLTFVAVGLVCYICAEIQLSRDGDDKAKDDGENITRRLLVPAGF